MSCGPSQTKVRAGQHADKLEAIRRQLQPHQQVKPVNAVAPTPQLDAALRGKLKQQKNLPEMLMSLTGCDRELAQEALQLCGNVTAAANYIQKTQDDLDASTSNGTHSAMPVGSATSMSQSQSSGVWSSLSSMDNSTRSVYSSSISSSRPANDWPHYMVNPQPTTFLQPSTTIVDDSGSGRSESPLARIPSPPNGNNSHYHYNGHPGINHQPVQGSTFGLATSVRSPSPSRHSVYSNSHHTVSVTPVSQPDYQRTHVNLRMGGDSMHHQHPLLTQSTSQPGSILLNVHTHAYPPSSAVISIQKTERERGSPRSLAPTTSLPLRDRTDRDGDGVPVMNAHFDRPPNRSRIELNGSSRTGEACKGFRVNILGESSPQTSNKPLLSHSSAMIGGHATPSSGYQSIFINGDDHSRAYVNYKDKIVPRSPATELRVTSSTMASSQQGYQIQSATPNKPSGATTIPLPPLSRERPRSGTQPAPPQLPATKPPQILTTPSRSNGPPITVHRVMRGNHVRSMSMLPDSIKQRLKDGTYEPFVESCKPRMFCFFMEQHVERLVQQSRERLKRATQLRKEMGEANLNENMREQIIQHLVRRENRYMRLKRQKLNKDMFEVRKHIGIGAFGRVSLVKNKETGQVYAMKSLLKRDVINKNQAAHVKAERDILAEADSDWVVRLYYSFQDERCLYFIMEYVPGGDMMELLIKKGWFDESLARFYIAELTCAIEYVHKLGFIHRDIKPDNILIDIMGHLKLTDFGLCTGLRWTHDKRYYGPENDDQPNHVRVDSFTLPPSDDGNRVAGVEQQMKILENRHRKKRNQAHSLVGTTSYMAPEVVLRLGHTQLCDWWSVGVILYEMVYGRAPFMSDYDDEIKSKIEHWRQHLRLYREVPLQTHTVTLSDGCISLIRQLCCDTTDRLGRNNGAADVMAHPWFRDIDFPNLRHQPALYIPQVAHDEDTSNFEPLELADFAKDSLRVPPNNPAFYEFTFRHFFDYDGAGCPSLRRRPPHMAPPQRAAPARKPIPFDLSHQPPAPPAHSAAGLPSYAAPPLPVIGAPHNNQRPPQPAQQYVQSGRAMHHIQEDSGESIKI